MIQRTALAAAVAALCTLGVAPASAADHGDHAAAGSGPNAMAPDAAKDFIDKTLSGVAFIPLATPQANIGGNSGLKTVMFQAYLRPDGTALVHAWDPATNRYTPTDTRPWRADGGTLCLTVPAFALPDALCIALHTWGPAFGGSGVNFNAMVKGDVRQGAALNN